MRVLKLTSITLAMLLLVAGLLISYITLTHGGMQRLFSLGKSYVQDELSWGELQGTLAGPGEIKNLAYHADDGTSVHIDNLKFDWHPLKLVQRQLSVDSLVVQGVVVRMPKPAESEDSKEEEPFQLKDLKLPVGAEIKNLSFSDISIFTHDREEPVVIDSVHLGGSGRDSDLQVLELSASAPTGAIKVDGYVNTSGSWPVSLTAAWQYQHGQLGQLQGQATAVGNVDELVVKHQLIGAIESNTVLNLNDVFDELTLSGVTTVETEDLGLLSASAENMPLSLEAQVEGGLNDLQVDATLASRHQVTGPFTMELTAHTDQRVVRLKQIDLAFDNSAAVISANGVFDLVSQLLDLDLQWSDLVWPLQLATHQNAPPLLKDSSGNFNIQASADGAAVKGDAVLEHDQTGSVGITVDVNADQQQVLVNALTVNGSGSDTRLDVSGGLSLADNTVDVRGEWRDLRWPFTGGAADFESVAGQFSVIGPLNDYQLELSLDAAGSNVPAGKWRVSGNGSENAFNLLQIDGQTLGGSIVANGTAGWNPQPEWNFSISGRDINPESHWSGFDARVDVDINSSGLVTEDGLSQNTDIVNIGGSYKGQPLDGSGGVSLVDGVLVVDNLSLMAGAANITATGSLGSDIDLQWNLDAPSLEELVPGFKGVLQVSGNHSGSTDLMESQITIQSATVDSETLRIGDLNGVATVDLSGESKSNLVLSANSIYMAGNDWESFTVNASGTPQSHTIDMQLNGSQGNFQLQGNGTLANNMWNGTLSKIDALATRLGDWSLNQPVAIVAAQEEITLRDLCLASNSASLCTSLTRAANGSVSASAQLQDFDVGTLRELLPVDVGIDIEVDGQAQVNLDESGQLKVTANAGFPNGVLEYDDDGLPVQSELGPSELRATIVDDTINTVVDLDLGRLGFIKLDAALDGITTNTQSKGASPDSSVNTGANSIGKINGTLKSELNDLSLIGKLIPSIESVRGRLQSNLAFTGALDAPRITGNANIDELSLEVPAVALKVADGALQLSGNGRGGMLVRGSIQSGEGELELDGNYIAGTGVLQMDVTGENFRVSDTSRQRIDISPNLMIRISDTELAVSGDLLVPAALIKTGDDSIIVESPDVVIVDSNEIISEQEQSDINLNVEVTLGDDIRVDAGQFDGELAGSVTVNQQPGQVMTGSGTIEVVSGDFLVYGQKLTMKRGRVLFSGGPIDDPALDLDVARDVTEHNVVAGVRVTGSAQTPVLELNSEPPQTDANTLSYILLGKPVDALGASYTLGRRITPELFISFGFDLFDRRETFTLRYQLSKRLALVGVQSETSGADLIYTLER